MLACDLSEDISRQGFITDHHAAAAAAAALVRPGPPDVGQLVILSDVL